MKKEWSSEQLGKLRLMARKGSPMSEGMAYMATKGRPFTSERAFRDGCKRYGITWQGKVSAHLGNSTLSD